MSAKSESTVVAEEIAERMGVRALFVKMLHGMLEPVLAGPRAAGKDLGPALAKIDALVDRMPVSSTVIETLERVCTLDELVGMRDFYRSPIGARVSRFAVDEAETISGLLTRWALAALLGPALRAAGISDRDAAQMGLPTGLTVTPAEWGGVDPMLRDEAIATVTAIGFTRRIDDLVAAQAAQIGPLAPSLPPEQLAASVDKRIPIELVARLYCEAFTRDELAAIRAFYATPIGQRTIELAPVFDRAGAEAMQSWMAANPGALESELQGIAALFE